MSQQKHILLLKTSSLGDLIHTFPALSDLQERQPNIRIHWVVEEGLKNVPSWHPIVERVIPVALRRWRKNPLKAYQSGEWKRFVTELNHIKYDAVIDAQGLLKSAFLIRSIAHRKNIPVIGYDRKSIREPAATMFYNQTFKVSKQQHAVERIRELFANAFNFDKNTAVGRFQLVKPDRLRAIESEKYAVFLHGTTWENKHWPETYWISLARQLSDQGVSVKLLWGNEIEHDRAKRISAVSPLVQVLPRMSLDDVSAVIAHASFAVAVDTGLCHLAAAFDIPTIALYGPTSAILTGSYGKSQTHLSSSLSCAPCLKRRCTHPDITLDKENTDTDAQPPCFAESNPETVLSVLLNQGLL